MTLALLSLGSNVDAQKHLTAAGLELRNYFADIRFSPVYRCPAVGFDGPDFYNAGAVFTTDMTAHELDRWLHELEDRHGRRRDVPRFSNRTLDIDLVLFGDQIIRGVGNLCIPRPDLKHAFVLKPLVDLEPEFNEPVSGASLAALWSGHLLRERPQLEPQAWKL